MRRREALASGRRIAPPTATNRASRPALNPAPPACHPGQCFVIPDLIREGSQEPRREDAPPTADFIDSLGRQNRKTGFLAVGAASRRD